MHELTRSSSPSSFDSSSSTWTIGLAEWLLQRVAFLRAFERAKYITDDYTKYKLTRVQKMSVATKLASVEQVLLFAVRKLERRNAVRLRVETVRGDIEGCARVIATAFPDRVRLPFYEKVYDPLHSSLLKVGNIHPAYRTPYEKRKYQKLAEPFDTLREPIVFIARGASPTVEELGKLMVIQKLWDTPIEVDEAQDQASENSGGGARKNLFEKGHSEDYVAIAELPGRHSTR